MDFVTPKQKKKGRHSPPVICPNKLSSWKKIIIDAHCHLITKLKQEGDKGVLWLSRGQQQWQLGHKGHISYKKDLQWSCNIKQEQTGSRENWWKHGHYLPCCVHFSPPTLPWPAWLNHYCDCRPPPGELGSRWVSSALSKNKAYLCTTKGRGVLEYTAINGDWRHHCISITVPTEGCGERRWWIQVQTPTQHLLLYCSALLHEKRVGELIKTHKSHI